MATLSSVLSQIRQNESGGNYGLTPQQNYNYPQSHASGAYQFQPATWQQYTQASGIGTQYSQAYQAPPNIQDAVAAYAATNGPGVNSQGLWGASAGSSGYATIDNYDVTPQQLAADTSSTGLASNAVPDSSSGQAAGSNTTSPYYTYDPGSYTYGGGVQTTSPDTPGSSGALQTGAGTPGFLPPAASGGPMELGITPGLASGISGWLNSAETAVGTAFRNALGSMFDQMINWFSRGFLIIVGVVIAAVALWRIMDPGGEKMQAMASRMEGAAA